MKSLFDCASVPSTDFRVLLEAKELVKALDEGTIHPGTKIPMITPTQILTPVAHSKSNSKNSSSNSIGINQKSQSNVNTVLRTNEEKETPKLDIMQHMLALSSDPNAALHVAIELVNSGEYEKAIEMLNAMSVETRKPGILATRGTARALTGDLAGAVKDFDEAIAAAPDEIDFYKRRAQALGALDRHRLALADMKKVLEREKTSDVLLDVARIYTKLRNFRRAVECIQQAQEVGGDEVCSSAPTLSLLASCQVSMGDLRQGLETYGRIKVTLLPISEQAELALNKGMALKELCHVGEARRELDNAIRLGKGTATQVTAHRLLAQMLQGMGRHQDAIAEVDAALRCPAALLTPSRRVELHFLRAVCYHALGLHRDAIEDYQRTLQGHSIQSSQSESLKMAPETISYMCCAFYQKEIALWTRAHLDEAVDNVCLDADLHPEFKELWCKKAPPGAEFVAMYRLIMQPQSPAWNTPRPRPPPTPEHLHRLVSIADSIGTLVQYNHQGFLPNRRQRRMAGLAAIEFAQHLVKTVRQKGEGKEDARPQSSSWRSAMDKIVKWRQIAEPNDQVLWVDMLTEKEFNAGFGSHTPMFTGQTKCVRYYANFSRAAALLRKLICTHGGKVYDSEERQIVVDDAKGLGGEDDVEVKSAEELWRAVGRDYWVVVPIASTTRKGHTLEGTRLTVVNLSERGKGTMEEKEEEGLDEGSAFEFSIRTPVTPARWADYDEELSALYARLLEALKLKLNSGTDSVTDDDQSHFDSTALALAYYWYNFMPLARGSAMCGYVLILGSFLAAGKPIQKELPPSYQVDWEAILESSPKVFVESVGSKILNGPDNESSSVVKTNIPAINDLPDVASMLSSMRERLEALNWPDGPAVV